MPRTHDSKELAKKVRVRLVPSRFAASELRNRRHRPTWSATTPTEVAALPRRWAFAGVAYAFGVTMLGTTLPTPLYPAHEQEFGFANLMTTVIYAVYAAGVLTALVLLGRASDVLGRRLRLRAGLIAWGLRTAGIAFTITVAALTLVALAAVLRLNRHTA